MITNNDNNNHNNTNNKKKKTKKQLAESSASCFLLSLSLVYATIIYTPPPITVYSVYLK